MLLDESLDKLRFREQLAQFCLKTLEEVPDSEPRKEDALREYREQLAEIQEAIRIAEQRPPDVIVQLNPAIMSGNVPK
jgi:hypothetical protein